MYVLDLHFYLYTQKKNLRILNICFFLYINIQWFAIIIINKNDIIINVMIIIFVFGIISCTKLFSRT